MTQFIQIHFLTSYPPSNLNRDDLGRPKTALMGGVNRLRISSQSLKRAWRKSELFESALGNHMGIRTKRMGRKIYSDLIAGGITNEQARNWTRLMSEPFGKVEVLKAKKAATDKDSVKKIATPENIEEEKLSTLDIAQLAHFSPEEQQAINFLVKKCIAEKIEPTLHDLKLLRKDNSAADIACFGRMLADNTGYNIEAAVQVAHAISTHAVDIEDDYFTAVDDLNDGSENSGSAHLGETEFASGLFYGYVCINRDLLKKNLGENELLTQKTIAALIEASAKISPTGKQNSFASRAYTSYMLVEKGSQQPRSISVAFLKPVKENDLLKNSIEALEKHRENIDKVYGMCADKFTKLNAVEGEGSLSSLIDFAKAE